MFRLPLLSILLWLPTITATAEPPSQPANRLIHEASPYLLQHAHNPVDWYPWGEDAFEKARKENRPIFLSIGYATCHWCHVMERESFNNPEIAQLLNQHFVAIKVDRERRPAVDAHYLEAVRQINGHAGWPLSVFLTPEGKPFFGGVYYPPEPFRELLLEVAQLWKQSQPKVQTMAEQLSIQLDHAHHIHTKAGAIDEKTIQKAITAILTQHDELQGGFGSAPKFPNEPLLYLLLNHIGHSSDPEVWEAVEITLTAMARGGIHDQIGGGFHRYATDPEWLTPHFEKMLYNQAHLSRIYLQGWQLSGNPEFEQVARNTLDYLLRDLQSSKGGFYSATDADSEGGEGRYFLWSIEELQAALPPQHAEQAITYYQLSQSGNFEGGNILYREIWQDDPQLQQVRQQMLRLRSHRPPPPRDEKIISAWNGMAITALAEASRIWNEPRYLNAAIKSAKWLWQHHYNPANHQLWRITLNGRPAIEGTQEDYAYLAEGYVALFDATADRVWLQRAEQLAQTMIEQFWDKQQGGFLLQPPDSNPASIQPLQPLKDHALPSGNSVALQLLQALSRRSEDPRYTRYTEQLLAAVASRVNHAPAQYAYLLRGAQNWLSGESGPLQYAAKGHIRIDAKQQGAALTIELTIAPQWHINSHQPLQPYLIATELQLEEATNTHMLEAIHYPEPVLEQLGFSQTPLSLYHGKQQIRASISDTATTPITLTLQLQACNDSTCLPPETVRLQLRDPGNQRIDPLEATR